MSFPGLYPDENKIIPYSRNKRFGFASPTEKIIELDMMQKLNIDQIIDLYKDGYRIAESSKSRPSTIPTIATAQGGVYISTGAILLIGLGLLGYYLYKSR